MKIALGTAQFGVDYGIANTSGRVITSEAKNILMHAKNFGVDTLDTAISYGLSEKCLGDIGVDDYKVVTKLPEIPSDCKNLSLWVNSHIKTSLKNLKTKSLYGLLLHRPSQLLDKNGIGLWDILLKLKSLGIVKKIGFSIYTPEELDKLWSKFKPDLVQSPFSILDRRLETSGWLQRLKEEDVEVHIRSIFLQGLLLMSKKNRPLKFNKWESTWDEWEDWLVNNNISSLQATISFALSDARISKVIVGVDNLNQFEKIVSASQNISKYPKSFYIKNESILNPSEWHLL